MRAHSDAAQWKENCHQSWKTKCGVYNSVKQMRSVGQKGEMQSIHGGQETTEGKSNRGSLTAIAPVPCRRAFRADITTYSLLLSGMTVMTLLYFAAEGPRLAGGGVERKKQLH